MIANDSDDDSNDAAKAMIAARVMIATKAMIATIASDNNDT